MTTILSLSPTPQAAVTLSQLGGDVTAYWHGTSATPPDQYRFACDAAAYCGTELLDDRDPRSLTELFIQAGRFFGKDGTPVCSYELKQARLYALAQRRAPCRVAFPFTSQQYRLAQRMTAVFSLIRGVTVTFPLIEAHLSPEECARIVFGLWGLAKPAMWHWLGETACLPCVRGTAAYVGELWQRNPDALLPLMQAERLTGATVLEDGALEDTLAACLHAANHRKSTEPLLWTPCLCK